MAVRSLGEAAVEVAADTSKFDGQLRQQIQDSGTAAGASGGQGFLKTFKSNLLGTGGIQSIALQAAQGFAAVFAAQAIVGGIVKTIGLASDLQEETAKLQTVFGDASQVAQEFADTGADAFNISRVAATKFTAEFGNLLTAFGITQKRAAETSVTLVKLAADLSSFSNVPVEEALQALRSGLVGEAEPLRRFGVVLNEARIQQQALTDGLISSTKEGLTPATKALAIFNLVMRDTATAQGDVARTSDSFANQTRDLIQNITDLATSLGTALLPVATAGVSVLRAFGDVLSLIPQDAIKFGVTLLGVSVAMKALLGIGNVLASLISSRLVPNFAAMAAGATTAANATAASTGRFASLVGAINPMTVAVTAAVFLFGRFRQAQEENERATKALADRIRELTDESERAAKGGLRELIVDMLGSRGIEAMESFGISLDDVVAAMQDSPQAVKALSNSIDGLGASFRPFHGEAAVVRIVLDQIATSMGVLATESEETAKQTEILSEVEGRNAKATRESKEAIEGLTKRYKDAQDAVKGYRDIIQAAQGRFLDAKVAQAELANSIQDARKEIDESGGSFDRSTRKGRDNFLTLSGVIQDTVDTVATLSETADKPTFAKFRADAIASLEELKRAFPEARALINNQIDLIRENAKTPAEFKVPVSVGKPAPGDFLAVEQSLTTQSSDIAGEIKRTLTQGATDGASGANAVVRQMRIDLVSLLKDIPVTFKVSSIPVPAGAGGGTIPGGRPRPLRGQQQ